jgi:3',5'-cyclic AMP phosphodiesterase CpdA
MRTLVHLSDLHFGRVDAALLAPLTRMIAQIAPDVVVVSGDLTQRARSAQFRAARAFLDSLPVPRVVVPGNHDIPLHNMYNRFLRPLDKYRKYVTPELEPVFEDEEIAVLGINTARSLTFKDGRVNRAQLERLRTRLSALDAGCTKIVVTHHPFDLPEHFGERHLVQRAPMAMDMFAQCGVDLLLAGHLHSSHAGNTAARYKISGYAALMVQAGTATSSRGRGELNSFNVIRVAENRITVERYSWEMAHGEFQVASCEAFERNAKVWVNATASNSSSAPPIP